MTAIVCAISAVLTFPEKAAVSSELIVLVSSSQGAAHPAQMRGLDLAFIACMCNKINFP